MIEYQAPTVDLGVCLWDVVAWLAVAVDED
jgi:hypothetical protein